MRNFTEKIGSLIFPKKDHSTISESIPFDFIRTRKGILKELVISNISGNVVGIYSRALGGNVPCGRGKIESAGKEEVIVLNRYDMSGQCCQGPGWPSMRSGWSVPSTEPIPTRR